jgi:hypothetical protein
LSLEILIRRSAAPVTSPLAAVATGAGLFNRSFKCRFRAKVILDAGAPGA